VTSETKPGLSILIPLKDEEGSIPALWAELQEFAVALMERFALPLEVVFVDDGSTDGTWQALNELESTSISLIRDRFRANQGKSPALHRALERSTYDLIATMDGDLQDKPDQLLLMLPDLSDADLVVGYKQDRKDPLSKRLPSRVFNRITGFVTGLALHDHNCGLKLGQREVFTSVPLYGEMHRYLAAIAHWAGFTVIERPVEHRPRIHGVSKFGLERYLRGAIDLLTVVSLTRFRGRPGHLFGGAGALAGLAGFFILAYLSGAKLFFGQPIGPRPLLILGGLLLALGVQLVSLGILAELITHQSYRYATSSRGRDRQVQDIPRDGV
jgi:glycosyltransferase involved in cell wall biosynthesis